MPDGHLPKPVFPKGQGIPIEDGPACPLCGREDLCETCQYWDQRRPGRLTRWLERRKEKK